MKKIVYVIIIAAMLFSCNESRIKIIPNYDLQYYSEKTVKTPAIPKDSTLGDKLNKKIVELLKSNYQNINKKIRGLSPNWRLYINNNGKVEYIKEFGNKLNPRIIENPESSFSRKILNQLLPEIEKWEFFPAIIFDNNVPSSIDLRGMFVYTREGSIKIYKPIKFNRDGNEYADYFVSVEKMPEPIGGIKAIQENIRYPEIAKRAGIEGRVFVKAYIDSTGTVAKTELIRGIGAGCDEAAMEAVKKVKFKPGVQRGKPVNTQVTVPILFKLDSSSDKEKDKK